MYFQEGSGQIMTMQLDDKVILITGGTGSFGTAMVRHLLSHTKPKAVRIFSRDEYKQVHLQRLFDDDRLRFFLGDIRDKDRVRRAFEGVDIVLNAAALKQVPVCEYNPFEAIQTNVIGGMNVVDAAIDCGVKQVMNISSDKAVSPVNLYGATKLCAEKVFIHGNSYTGKRGTRFSCVRYGNVVGSRGSVLPLFIDQAAQKKLTITDKRMTRFWIDLEEAVQFVVRCLGLMVGGEIFVPKIPSMKVVDLAQSIAPDAEIKEIGIRPGEKLHEILVMMEEAKHTISFEDLYIILPEWFHATVTRPYKGSPLPENFSYSSDQNDVWLDAEQMQKMVSDYKSRRAWLERRV